MQRRWLGIPRERGAWIESRIKDKYFTFIIYRDLHFGVFAIGLMM